MHEHGAGSAGADVILAIPFVFAAIFYLCGVAIQFHHGRRWPWRRTAAWVAGIIAAASGFVGPLAAAGHDDFTAHMGAHVLVGMVAPLLLVAAAPVTLALRTLQVGRARRVSRLLRSWPARFFTAPVVAAVLNVGGMWALYRTPVFQAMQDDPLLHWLVMTHFLLAGYLFTAAIIPTDPAPHRAGYPLRMVVLVVAFGFHDVLAKHLYAHPPVGFPAQQVQAGAMLMYYAGSVVDIVIITVLCAQWYRTAGHVLRRTRTSAASSLRKERRVRW